LLVASASLAADTSDTANTWVVKRRRPASDVSPPLPELSAPANGGKSFADVYKAALERAYTVNVQQEIIDQDAELDTQAKAALFPTITGAATLLEQQTPSNNVGSSISPANQNTVKITADQPIFRGFRDFAALRQRKDLLNSAKYTLQDAARTLFYNTAQAYYNVLALESDEFNYKNEIAVNQKRLTELQGFVRIGRSQITDVLGQESTISGLEATLENTHGQLESAKEVLAFFTGMDRNMPIWDNETPPEAPESVAFYLEKIEQRPDVKAAVASLQGNEEGIPIARGQHLPSIDVLGDYYFTRPGDALSGVNWDVALAITVPIFQGGAILSQTRQAESVARQFNIVLQSTRAAAAQEISQFYDAFAADQRQIVKLAETADVSKKNYDALIKEYRNGLVTNLDVLTGITTWQTAVLNLAHQRFTAKQDWVKLQAASAQRKEIFIESKKD
jgi:outer membrane protein